MKIHENHQNHQIGWKSTEIGENSRCPLQVRPSLRSTPETARKWINRSPEQDSSEDA
jgi:hypothetical protein